VCKWWICQAANPDLGKLSEQELQCRFLECEGQIATLLWALHSQPNRYTVHSVAGTRSSKLITSSQSVTSPPKKELKKKKSVITKNLFLLKTFCSRISINLLTVNKFTKNLKYTINKLKRANLYQFLLFCLVVTRRTTHPQKRFHGRKMYKNGFWGAEGVVGKRKRLEMSFYATLQEALH